MIVVMRRGAPEAQRLAVEERVRGAGLLPHPIVGTERSVVAVVGDERVVEPEYFEVLAGVEKVLRVLAPSKLASREGRPEKSAVEVAGVPVGAEAVVLMAGPCTVEDRSQLIETAHAVKEAGARLLRGGAFKPRTNPYSFQGLAEEGLALLAEAREATGLAVVTEVLSEHDVDLVAKYADMLQIGTRNMQNFLLLRAVGAQKKPVLLKRGMSASLDEWLLAAEYILSCGNERVVLCERGIRTFEDHVRNTLPLVSVPALRERTHLPVVVDPSHGTGHASLVPAASLAAVAVGADGLLVEVAPDPASAVTDGAQTLSLRQFAELAASLRPVAAAVARSI